MIRRRPPASVVKRALALVNARRRSTLAAPLDQAAPIAAGCSAEVSLGRTPTGVFVLCLNGPASNPENRWVHSFCAAIHNAFDAIESELANAASPREPAALLTVSASPKFFSNGIDPESFQAASAEERNATIDLIMPAFARPLLLPIPTVCALGGHTFGAGLMFALGHDWRSMREDRGFACAVEVAIGLKTPSPEFTLFSHSVPNDTFYQMVMLGERYGGKDAERAGIVQLACGAEELHAASLAKAEGLAQLCKAGAMSYYKRELKQFVAEEILRWEFPCGRPKGGQPLPPGLQAHVDRLVVGDPPRTWGMRHREFENQYEKRLVGESFFAE